jgi:hypothetical protein
VIGNFIRTLKKGLAVWAIGGREEGQSLPALLTNILFFSFQGIPTDGTSLGIDKVEDVVFEVKKEALDLDMRHRTFRENRRPSYELSLPAHVGSGDDLTLDFFLR